MTVVDSSAVVDYLLRGDAFEEVAAIWSEGSPLSAPDVVMFEVIAVLRRVAARDELHAQAAAGAIGDLARLSLELFPTLALSQRAWTLRANFTAADALFVALAELLDEPLMTKDRPLAAAAAAHSSAEVILVG